MPFTIGIDTGGTFTDGYFSSNEMTVMVKVDTTPHDLTVGFAACLEEGARRLGLADLPALLRSTASIRFSTTIGLNTLIQGTGPKLGLLVSKGQEAYFQDNPLPILPADLVVGITGRVDSHGHLREEIDPEEVRHAVKKLLMRGARALVVSLENAVVNPALEQQVKDIVETDYPPHCMGAVPVFISTAIDLSHDDARRTNAVLLNAYIHRELARFLYRAEDGLRLSGYHRPLLVSHNWGGVARVAKTRALNTLSSGPVAVLQGVAHVYSLYGHSNAVFLDVGGTSTDFGLVIGGTLPVQYGSDFQGILTDATRVETFSIGAGGGSIASVQNGNLTVGPRSAGAVPGPVCYDLGGTKSTATDAALVLGYIADRLLGGRKQLNTDRTVAALESQIARPLDCEVHEAAQRIIARQIQSIAGALRDQLEKKGLSPRDVVLFSLGGGGGLYCSAVADEVGIRRILVPPFASVSGAFGSSLMDVLHGYEAAARLVLRTRGGESGDGLDTIDYTVAGLQKSALRDMRSEGLAAEQVQFTVEVTVNAEGTPLTIALPDGSWRGQESAQFLLGRLPELLPSLSGTAEVVVTRIKLLARCALERLELAAASEESADAGRAQKGTRQVFWANGARNTPVYDRQLLPVGCGVYGPAIIEAEDTTILIPEGRRFLVDTRLFGIIEPT